MGFWKNFSLILLWFPGGSDGKESACNARDLGSIPGLGRSLGEGNDNLPQYSCLENSMDRRAWWATVHGVAKIQTPINTFVFFCDTGELSFNLVTLSYLTLCDCMGYSLPGSSVHGILQARILEWVAIPFSRGSS